MADDTNGKATEEDPSEREVKSSIVMRIDAPDTEQPDDDDEDEVVSRPYVSHSFSSISRSFPPHRPSPSSSSFFGSIAQFCHSSSSSSNHHGSYNSKSSSTVGSSNVGSPAAKPLLLRPSQLAVASNEVTNSDSAEHRIGSTTGQEADNTEPSVSDVSASDRSELSSTQSAPTLKFVPLGASLHHKEDNCSVGTSGVSSSASSFVFGQNLHARQASVAVETPDSTSGRLSQPLPGTSQVATSNGTNASEMLFTSVIQCEPANSENGATGSSEVERSSKSLSEAAAEYEESRSKKRKYEEVSLFTGEEGEVNVGQVNCRLYIYDNTSGQYQERGRGTLRVNDSPGGAHSRVLMRATGSLRVVLNTKIWSGMSVGRPSAKSIRLTAMESTGQIKVFLVMASLKEIDTLHKLLLARVARCFHEAKATESEADESPTALQSKRRDVQDAGGGGGELPDEPSSAADL